MAVLILACSAEVAGALVAVTGALVVITTEAKRRWDLAAYRAGRRPDRRKRPR